MLDLPILSLIILLPLVGGGFVLLIPGGAVASCLNMRAVTLFTSLLTFVLSVVLYINFDSGSADFQFIEKLGWLAAYGIEGRLGVDGLSVSLILLTTFVTPFAILSTWNVETGRVREYMLAFLILEALIIGTFCALDLILFYVFFEGVLIPMYFIIGIWGGPRRFYASYKFFLFTLFGSVLMLVAILYLCALAETTDITKLVQYGLAEDTQRWLWMAFFVSFAVKLPMWPLHTWLPDAHVEAPTAGSVILASVLLKMGGYGMIRFSLPLFPDASMYFADGVFILSAIAVVYASLIALVQRDMKKRIAYSSIAHMGFVAFGVFTFNMQGLQGAIFQMVSHGLVSAALFLCVGVLYDRAHTRDIDQYGGISQRMPFYAAVFLMATFAAIGLPGTSGFIGEILVLIGAFKVQWYWTALLGSSVILSAGYMLWLYRRVMLGEITTPQLQNMVDLNVIEKLCLIPLIIAIVGLGLYPNCLLRLTEFAAQQALDPIGLKFFATHVVDLGTGGQ